MSNQTTSPGPLPQSSQQQRNENNAPPSSSPNSTADSAVHMGEVRYRMDADSSFRSNASERHPKGKRKRTAAKDKAVLEAAYNANPKPDKAARLDIVKRVSLNEKEVQIWFQNRRQNDRRKSRPLSPQEIAALQYGGMQVLSDPAPYGGSQPQVSGLSNPNTSPYQQPSFQERPDASPPQAAREHAQPEAAAESTVGLPEPRHNRRESAASMGATVVPSSQLVEFTAGQPHQLYRSASVGYFANRLHAGTPYQANNRRSPDSLRHEFLSAAARPSSAAPVLPPPLSSGLRLSMSAEGKAELVPQSSPPRLSPSTLSDSAPDPYDRPSLHRSRSAAARVTLPPISTLTASLDTNAPRPTMEAPPTHQPQPRLPHSLHRSRSRDVHAWEMACEANIEPRDELTAYAARESSGSAIAAISLLRSLSSSSHSSMTHGSGILQPNGAKRNARPNAQPNHNAKKPKLGRALSSVGRLQTNFVNNTTDKPPVRREQTPVEAYDLKGKVSVMFSPGCNDSDKENWSPDKEGRHMFHSAAPRPANGRRPLPSEPMSKLTTASPQKPRRGLGRMLGDTSNGRSLLGRARTAPSSAPRLKKASTPVSIFEDGAGANSSEGEGENDDDHRGSDAIEDDEVERFMRGEVSPSKKGAASAIAGLLALSQGNWR